MRLFASTLVLLAPIFIGASANASSMVEVCHPNRVIAESDREAKEAHFYTGHEERNATIQAWLKTATPEEITDIWGDPFVSEDDILRWEIPSEGSQHVSESVFERDGTYSYYSSHRRFAFVVQEPRVKVSNDDREITRIIKLGSSIFKRKE